MHPLRVVLSHLTCFRGKTTSTENSLTLLVNLSQLINPGNPFHYIVVDSSKEDVVMLGTSQYICGLEKYDTQSTSNNLQMSVLTTSFI